MLNKNAKKWVKALLSGKYKQGRNYLKTDDKFCCLGVACDIYAKEHKIGKWKYPTSTSDNVYAFSFLGATETLPAKVQRWLGLEGSGGEFMSNGYSRHEPSLYGLNDENKWSLEKIGKFIASEPEGLFK